MGRAVTAANMTLTLDDGSRVIVNASTVFEQYGDLMSFSAIANSLSAGQRVKVDGRGVRQPDGSILASVIEAKIEGTKFEGRVTKAANMTLTLDYGTRVVVNAYTVFDPYSDLASFSAIANAIAAGQNVYVEGKGAPQADGSILAGVIDADIQGDGYQFVTFEGYVAKAYNMVLTLDYGTRVVVNGYTVFDPYGDFTSFTAIANALAAGKKVKVEGKGTRQPDGSILASNIKAKVEYYDDDYETVKFKGYVVKAFNMTLTLDDGTRVIINAATVFDDDSELTSFTAIANAVAAGQKVEVEGKGTRQPDGSILATKIEADVEDDDDDDDDASEVVKFEGHVVKALNMTLTLDDGTLVIVNSATVFDEDSDLMSFTAIANAVAAGRKVEVDGKGTRQADGSILATKIDADVDDD